MVPTDVQTGFDPAWVKPVIEIARQAGQAIMEVYRNPDATVEHKADDSPLTQADLAAHSVIATGLDRLTPHILVVSEEDVASHARRVDSNLFWLIDPLDGTKEFIARNGEFTVNIACVHNGRAVWGVVYAPALDELFWGGPGIGAWQDCGGRVQALSVSPPVAIGACYRVVASKSHLNEQTRQIIEQLGQTELVQAGSSLKFCRLAQGAADVYPRLAPTCEWDTAAAQAVLEAAGGYVLQLDGQPVCYGKQDILNPQFIAATVTLEKLPITLANAEGQTAHTGPTSR